MARPRKHPDLPEQSPQEMMETMLGVRDVHVIGIDVELVVLRAVVETVTNEAVCPQCATPAELFDRPTLDVADEQIFGREVVFEWHVKRWRCPNHRCETDTWDEKLPPVGLAQWRQGREQ